MATVILLSTAEADQVRGPSGESPGLASCQPVALANGDFYLGVETLGDPNFAEHHALLSGLAQVDFDTVKDLLLAPG